MKNWKTTVLGILGAGLVLAKANGWIDEQTSVFIGALIVAVFGAVASDGDNKLIGTRPPKKDQNA